MANTSVQFTIKIVPAILTINGGSSSLKFAIFATGHGKPQRTVSGEIERIGLPNPTLRVGSSRRPVKVQNHAEALALVLEQINETPGAKDLSAVAHRVVHGGPLYRQHQPVNAAMLAELERLSPFDPEHLPADISLIRCCTEAFPAVPQFACFDTAFHRDLPRVAYLLPIPRKYEKRGIRRYGFHGLSCSWLMQQLKERAGEEAARGRVVIAHLGNGASMTAVHNGRSVDTTMSFTPTAGLVMSRRTGDLDPSLAAYLIRIEKMSVDDFQHMVNAESGLLGISETSSDMRDLLDAQQNDARAADAVDSFCYNAKKHLAGLAAVLGGLDTLIFSAGIGENNAEVRARICHGLEFLGIELDSIANNQNGAIISKKTSKATVHVIKTDEEMYIAQTITALLRNEVTS
ncbi:MAG: Acetate kinase [Verrucomicrobiales bacterium]|nr:Acetate kinase [Verrucomicrobiales bacterium]